MWIINKEEGLAINAVVVVMNERGIECSNGNVVVRVIEYESVHEARQVFDMIVTALRAEENVFELPSKGLIYKRVCISCNKIYDIRDVGFSEELLLCKDCREEMDEAEEEELIKTVN